MMRMKYIVTIIHVMAGFLYAQQGWFSVSAGDQGTHVACSFISADTGWVVREVYGVYKTTNGGKGWEGQYINYLDKPGDIQFIDKNTGWMCGSNKSIFKTTDGGENWQLVLSNTLPEYSFSYIPSIFFLDKNLGYCAGYQYNRNTSSYESILLKSINGGDDWTPQTAGAQNFVISSIFFITKETGWTCGEKGIIYKTENGGANWVEKNSKTSSSLFSIFFINALKGWVAGAGGIILASSDGGDTWTPQTSPTSNTLWEVQFLTENIGYACGPDGTILKTLEGGHDWHQQVSGTSAGLSDILFFSADTGYCVGAEGTILKTVNGGVGTNSLPEENLILPKHVLLYQNYPNPFNPNTTINYDLQITNYVDLSIFNIEGQKVMTLVAEKQAAGAHSVKWDTSYRQGLASGIYYYRLRAGEFIETKKMILLQ